MHHAELQTLKQNTNAGVATSNFQKGMAGKGKAFREEEKDVGKAFKYAIKMNGLYNRNTYVLTMVNSDTCHDTRKVP